GMGLVRLDQHRPRHPAIAVMHLPLLIHPAKHISTSDADGSDEYQDGKGYESRHKKDLPASAVSPADPARPFELRHITAAPARGRPGLCVQCRHQPAGGRARSYMSYARSPCEVMSRPSRSSSSVTRSPTTSLTM